MFTHYPEDMQRRLIFNESSEPATFAAAQTAISQTKQKPAPSAKQLHQLRTSLLNKRDFVLRLLENPNLQEHEQLTDLLFALSHCIDELHLRDSFHDTTTGDKNHLDLDIARSHQLNLSLWINYMQLLKKSYPYLFSLAQRTNPFDTAAKIQFE